MSIERRVLHRRRTYLGGKISFDDSYCVVECLIRDMSRNGARLIVDLLRFNGERFGG
jgi:hypothetical protein